MFSCISVQDDGCRSCIEEPWSYVKIWVASNVDIDIVDSHIYLTCTVSNELERTINKGTLGISCDIDRNLIVEGQSPIRVSEQLEPVDVPTDWSEPVIVNSIDSISVKSTLVLST